MVEFSTPRTSALRQLKAATADLHAEAERHVRILDPDATEATYTRYLGRMFGFHAPLEDRFAVHRELLAAGFDASARRKQGWLRADLSALGVRPDDLPRCPRLPDLDGLARGLGAAYVVEGSTLGGRFILTRMHGRLGHLRGRATGFLEGYGAATGPLWRRFAELAESALAAPEARAAAIAAARDTFVALTAWLEEPGRDQVARFGARRAEART